MFEDLIKEIWTKVGGLENLMLTGIDGMVVARHHQADEDDYLAAEAANLIKESTRFGNELDSGRLLSMCSQYEERTIVIQMITEEYFLLGVMNSPKNLGYFRYLLTLKSYEWYSAIA